MQMINILNNKLVNWVYISSPWTNVYGLARTILALSTIIALTFNDADIFFRPTSDSPYYPICTNRLTIFCIVNENNYSYLNILRFICIFILLIVAIGWKPRVTGILHWWINWSIFNSATTIDGGEQVAAVFTFLLIPITLTDPRDWHWQNQVNIKGVKYTKIFIAKITFIFIRIQIAIIYFNSIVAKLIEEEWINGTAVWYYMQSPMLGLNPNLFEWLTPLLGSSFIVIPTWVTLIAQIILVMSLIAPKKYWNTIFIISIFMHEIFGLFLGIFTFSFIMIAVLILYLRPVEKPFRFKGGGKDIVKL